MFGTQNMAMPLLPGGAQPNLPCFLGHSGGCGYYTCGYPLSCQYYPHTRICIFYSPCVITIYEQVQQFVTPGCPVGIARDPGDPLEDLQRLRRQLEVALAGVRAQEDELRRQHGTREEGQQARGGRGAGAQRSE